MADIFLANYVQGLLAIAVRCWCFFLNILWTKNYRYEWDCVWEKMEWSFPEEWNLFLYFYIYIKPFIDSWLSTIVSHLVTEDRPLLWPCEGYRWRREVSGVEKSIRSCPPSSSVFVSYSLNVKALASDVSCVCRKKTCLWTMHLATKQT